MTSAIAAAARDAIARAAIGFDAVKQLERLQVMTEQKLREAHETSPCSRAFSSALLMHLPPASDAILLPALTLTENRTDTRARVRAGAARWAERSPRPPGVHLLTVLQAKGLTLAAAVDFGALVGPSQVAARTVEMVIARWVQIRTDPQPQAAPA